MCGRTEKTAGIPVINTVLTRPVTDLMGVVCLGVTVGSMEKNAIRVYVIIEAFISY